MAVYKPPHKIQMRLQKIFKHPISLFSLITSFPNGHSTKPAILKHCKPHGIPIIVAHKTKPPTQYPRAASNPPKTNQTRFPKKLSIMLSDSLLKKTNSQLTSRF